MRFLKWMGRGLSNFFAGLAALSMIAVGVGWATNYTLTQGAGTTFGSLVVAGVNYAQHFICDATTPSQCTAVNSSGQIAIQAPPSLPLPTGAATAANQTIVNTWASGTLGAMANYGTSPGAVLVPGVNAFVTNASPNGAHNTANSPTVNIASDQWADPCMGGVKTNVPIATSSGTVQLVAPSGSTQVYVCSFSLFAAATAVVNLVGGTGATCTTGTPVAVMGSTTAASGMSLAANGGLTFGNGGATVARTTTAGHGLCLIQSGTTALAGNATIVQQ